MPDDCKFPIGAGQARVQLTGPPQVLRERPGFYDDDRVELLADPEARADLVAAGRIRADKYDWSRVADQILRVYDTVTVGAGPVVVSD